MLTREDMMLGALASSQWGVFDHLEAERAGIDRHALLRRQRSGHVEVLHRGVYRYRGGTPSWEQDCFAAVRFNGPDAALSCRAAARLWGLPGFASADVELSKPRGRSQRRAYGWVHGSTMLPAKHLVVRSHIPVTTPARTIFDLAGRVHPGRAERALDNALSLRLCSITQLDDVFNVLARRGRAGTVVMRELLEARGDGYVAPSSELERVGRALIRDFDLRGATVEREIGPAAGRVGRVDLLFADARLVVELDSRRHHTAFLDRGSDRERDNKLMAAGWVVLRYTWWDLTERPAEVADEIRATIGRRT